MRRNPFAIYWFSSGIIANCYLLLRELFGRR